MELNDTVILILLKDSNKWEAVKGYATRNHVSEIEALNLASKNIEPIEPYDETLAINFADAIYNYCNEN